MAPSFPLSTTTTYAGSPNPARRRGAQIWQMVAGSIGLARAFYFFKNQLIKAAT